MVRTKVIIDGECIVRTWTTHALASLYVGNMLRSKDIDAWHIYDSHGFDLDLDLPAVNLDRWLSREATR